VNIMLCGNIGTGKSTVASKLALNHNYIIINDDSLITSLHGGNYMYKQELKNFYKLAKQQMARCASLYGLNCVLDGTFITREKRKRWLKIISSPVICLDFGPGNNISLKRRQNNSRGKSLERWEIVHKLFKYQYEQPSITEGFEKVIGVNDAFETKSIFI